MMSSINRISNRWSNHMLILTFKCLKEMCLGYLCNQFNFVHNIHNYITRSHTSNTLIVPKCNSNSGKRTYLVRAANLWNNVPPSICTVDFVPFLNKCHCFIILNIFVPHINFMNFVFFCIIINLVYL